MVNSSKSKIKSKKAEQLGMDPGTASHRLIKNLLWNFISSTGNERCFRCGQPMTRETFSVEHKEPWLDSSDPVGLYFNLENITYSHRVCNYKASRPGKLPTGKTQRDYNKKYRESDKARYKKQRREKYLRTGT